jgi:hypothetical protein
MKSLHDYRGEYAAACRRYGRAFNRWARAERWTQARYDLAAVVNRFELAMFAARDRYHARLNTPKRKVSRRAARRASAYLAELARLIEQNRLMGPRPVRIHVRDASELPAVRKHSPDGDIHPLAFHLALGIQIVVVPELESGFGFVEYSDGSLQKVRLGIGAAT